MATTLFHVHDFLFGIYVPLSSFIEIWLWTLWPCRLLAPAKLSTICFAEICRLHEIAIMDIDKVFMQITDNEIWTNFDAEFFIANTDKYNFGHVQGLHETLLDAQILRPQDVHNLTPLEIHARKFISHLYKF